MNKNDIYKIYIDADAAFNCILGFSCWEQIKEKIGEEKIKEAKNIIRKRLEEIREDKSFSISLQQHELVKYFKDLLSKKIDKKDDSFYSFYTNIEDFINQEYRIINKKAIIKLLPKSLKQRYEELILAINNNMPFSFFWLAGSIIEGILYEYCKKNDIKSSNHNIEGYITAIEEDEKHKKIIAGITKKVIQIYKDYRNTIHSNNVNNNFIKNKNLQNRKEELDDVITFFFERK